MLTQKSMSELNLDDQVLQRFQVNVQNAVNPVLQTEILDGVLVTGITIRANNKALVPHGLGRPSRGVLLVAANAPTSLPYQVPADQTSPNGAVLLSFTSGAGATISCWVF